MKLSEGERILLDDGSVGFRRKITLTNKRLIFQKKKGFISTSWVQDDEIPLDKIEEAYVEIVSKFSGKSAAMLRMKNGESIELGLKLTDSEVFGADFGGEGLAGMNLRLKMTNDRWVNAINNQLAKNRIDQSKSGAYKCPKCGKDMPQGDFDFCPFCGNSLTNS